MRFLYVFFFFLGLLVFALFSLVSFYSFSRLLFLFSPFLSCVTPFLFSSVKKETFSFVNDIDRSNRIEKIKERSIIIKFVQCKDWRKAFSNKERLKDFGISVTESLTARRMEELSKARSKHGFKNAWILFKKNGSTKATTLSCG